MSLSHPYVFSGRPVFTSLRNSRTRIHSIISGAIYGLAIAVATAVFASSVGSWIDRTPRLRAAIILLIVQNLSVAIAAIIEIFGITQMLHSPVSNYVMIGFVTLLGCTGMLGHVGMTIVLERDWIPQVFKGEGLFLIFFQQMLIVSRFN